MNTAQWLVTLTMLALLSCPLLAQDRENTTQPAVEPTPVSEPEAKRAEELFQSGRKLFFQGKYLDAIQQLKAAAEANPNKTSYQLLLAKSHRYAGQAGRSIEVLESVLKSSPDHVEAGIELAELLTPKKHPDRVIAVLEPLLKFKHDYPLYHLLAEAHYQKESFDKAREYFEVATKLNPRNAEDHYQLGNIYLAQKRFAKAAASYEQAGALGLSSGVYHFKLASVYFNLHKFFGKVATAEVIGGRAGEIKNQMYLIDPVPGKKDQFYIATPQSAIFQVARAQKLGVDVFDIKFLEANIWLSARRFANAEKIYKGLQEEVRKEDLGLYWYYRAQTALGMNEYDDYLQRLRKAIEVEPDVYEATLADAFVTVANRFHQTGDSENYIAFLGKAVDTNPLSASLHLSLGDAFWLASNSDRAIEQYKLVLELEPDHGERVRLLNRIRGQEEIGGQ